MSIYLSSVFILVSDKLSISSIQKLLALLVKWLSFVMVSILYTAMMTHVFCCDPRQSNLFIFCMRVSIRNSCNHNSIQVLVPYAFILQLQETQLTGNGVGIFSKQLKYFVRQNSAMPQFMVFKIQAPTKKIT